MYVESYKHGAPLPPCSDIPQFMQVDKERWGVPVPSRETQFYNAWNEQWSKYNVSAPSAARPVMPFLGGIPTKRTLDAHTPMIPESGKGMHEELSAT